MLSYRRASTNDMHISVACSVLVYISRNTVARAINMSMVYAVALGVPHIKTGAVTSVTGEYEKIRVNSKNIIDI